MKKISVLILFSAFLIFFISQKAYCQDILTLKSGREIKAIIEEENPTSIKYREYDVENSPLYTIDRTKVESIKYRKQRDKESQKPVASPKGQEQSKAQVQASSGENMLTVKKRYVFQDGVALSSRQIKTLMEDNQEALTFYEKGHRQVNASNACAGLITGVCLASALISNKWDDDKRMKASATALVISGGLAITGIVLASNGKKNIRRSAEMYNNRIKPVSYINFYVSPLYAGIALRF
ncbi:MAG TPA: hypothetical protein VHO68_00360 [Bacteroidales bacterium]|nr:hypothetical protein [Bacteroidales bacterium]